MHLLEAEGVMNTTGTCLQCACKLAKMKEQGVERKVIDN